MKISTFSTFKKRIVSTETIRGNTVIWEVFARFKKRWPTGRNSSQFLYQGITEIMECLRKVNLLIQTEKPWELKKAENFEKLGAVINLSLNSVRICAILLQPIIPGLADNILCKLNVQKRTFEDAKSLMDSEYNENHKLSHEKVTVFKKI